MLRIKRSVQAMYNTQFTANLISQQTAQGMSAAILAGEASQKQDAMATLAQEQLQGPPKRVGDVSFVRGETLLQPSTIPEKVENPDEIQLDDDDEDEEEDGEDKGNFYITIYTLYLVSLKLKADYRFGYIEHT